ncbi:hypothetical protein [Streptomyces sp. IBSBF 2507]|uniref:hypothetical protein n=1 Tax=Streptomyces sp. IBSBF 2507 TaxID=2903530 RepID=UPI00351F03D2
MMRPPVARVGLEPGQLGVPHGLEGRPHRPYDDSGPGRAGTESGPGAYAAARTGSATSRTRAPWRRWTVRRA